MSNPENEGYVQVKDKALEESIIKIIKSRFVELEELLKRDDVAITNAGNVCSLFWEIDNLIKKKLERREISLENKGVKELLERLAGIEKIINEENIILNKSTSSAVQTNNTTLTPKKQVEVKPPATKVSASTTAPKKPVAPTVPAEVRVQTQTPVVHATSTPQPTQVVVPPTVQAIPSPKSAQQTSVWIMTAVFLLIILIVLEAGRFLYNGGSVPTTTSQTLEKQTVSTTEKSEGVLAPAVCVLTPDSSTKSDPTRSWPKDVNPKTLIQAEVPSKRPMQVEYKIQPFGDTLFVFPVHVECNISVHPDPRDENGIYRKDLVKVFVDGIKTGTADDNSGTANNNYGEIKSVRIWNLSPRATKIYIHFGDS